MASSNKDITLRSNQVLSAKCRESSETVGRWNIECHRHFPTLSDVFRHFTDTFNLDN